MLLVLGLAGGLGACSAGAFVDKLPAGMGGEPADVPARSTTPYVYPAVHDMPPPRATPPMTEEQQITLEKDLQTVRDQQQTAVKAAEAADAAEAAAAASPVLARPPPPPNKKKAAAAKKDKDQVANAKDGAKTNP